MFRQRAFTLVELLVVILVIGVLLALVVPNFVLMVERARRSAVRANMRVVHTALEAYALDHNGSFPVFGGTDNPSEPDLSPWFPGGDPFGDGGEPRPGVTPINPYTRRRYNADVLDLDYTTLYGELEPGQNARMRGDDEDCPYLDFGGIPGPAGGIGIATHVSDVPPELPDEYGIFGFGRSVEYPMYEVESGAVDPTDSDHWVFVVLHN